MSNIPILYPSHFNKERVCGTIMIKGVNKQIIEINCTENEYFDKAFLFVNPDKAALDRSRLNTYAEDYLKGLHCRRKKTAPGPFAFVAVRFCAAALSGAAVFWLVQQILR